MSGFCSICGSSLNPTRQCPSCPSGASGAVPPVAAPPPVPPPIAVPPVIGASAAPPIGSGELTVIFDAVPLLVGSFYLKINERIVHSSSFSQGFVLKFNLPLGVHQVQTRIELMGLYRNQSTTVQIGPRGATVELDYSRLTGNFQRCKVHYL